MAQNTLLETQTNDGVEEMRKKNKAIVNALIDAGMTQTELAERLEMHLTHINAIVNGSRPKVDNAIRVARALGKTVEELWGDGGE